MNNTLCKTIFFVMLAILMVCAAVPALAKVTADEAAKLKTVLNPMGGERAGNEEGTIPAWTGGLSKIPTNITYKAKSGLPHPDPFADDKILFTITAENVNQYKDKLSPGILSLFERYPDTWKMNIYPTRRSVAYSEEHYESMYNNALTAEVVDREGSIINFYKGFPFPIPTNGMEAMLNHLQMPFGTRNSESTIAGGFTYKNGHIEKLAVHDVHFYLVEGVPKEQFDPADFIIGYIVSFEHPGHKGEMYLYLSRGDYRAGEIGGWVYTPGTRRVRRAPNMFYDGVNFSHGGIGCADDQYIFNGKLDRFDWKLEGKKEMFIPYNTYMIDLLPEMDAMLPPHHPDPKYLRWELHRVWINVATLRDGYRHIYSKKIFYQDEDSWLASLKDDYDTRGGLWRSQFACGAQFYDFPAYRFTQYFEFDNQVDYYGAKGFTNGLPPIKYDEISQAYFTPSNLRKLGKR